MLELSNFQVPQMTIAQVTRLVVTCGLFVGLAPAAAAPRSDGQLEIELVDSQTKQPIAARMHLKNSRGRPVRLRAAELAPFGDHFYIDGRAPLGLRVGQYTFELEAGPEFRTQTGHFEIERHAEDVERIELRRFADLAKEGWWAGDLDAHRSSRALPLAMRAESLAYVPEPADVGQSAAEAGLLVFELPHSIDVDQKTPLEILRAAKAAGGRAVARTPFAWDLPGWLASGELDAIELIHHHALRDSVVDGEAGGRPRDKAFFPGRTGNGRWSEAIYYHVLNCGLRVPPAAGSGSGSNGSPLGTNRVYVHCGDEFSPERWWDGLDAGAVFVTNGPLLRPLVEGRLPGYVFHLNGRKSISLEIGLELATRVPVEYLQVIKNGRVDVEVRLDKFAESGGRLPTLEFDGSGWFLARAVTNSANNYQFASSGPYYVEAGGRPRISRTSVEFFLDWIDERTAQLRSEEQLAPALREKLLAEQASARTYFESLLAAAGAE